jgi:ribosomal-protein-alanine N-acetyltransferase
MHSRAFNPEDFDALYAIEEVCFQPPFRFSRRYLRSLIDAVDAATWLAEEDGKIAGFAVVEWFEQATKIVAYLQTIEVLPEFRSRGVASRLLQRVEASAHRAGASALWLHVDATNTTAIRFYEKHDYSLRGREDHYYAQGRAALIYWKLLSATRGARETRTPKSVPT